MGVVSITLAQRGCASRARSPSIMMGKRRAVRSQVTDIDSLSGLSGAEAIERLRADGPNDLPAQERQTFVHALVDGIREPMTALLLGCGAIYFFLSDSHEAAMLLAFVAFIVAITLYQERKTERAIAALRDLASPRALVIRDERRQRLVIAMFAGIRRIEHFMARRAQARAS